MLLLGIPNRVSLILLISLSTIPLNFNKTHHSYLQLSQQRKKYFVNFNTGSKVTSIIQSTLATLLGLSISINMLLFIIIIVNKRQQRHNSSSPCNQGRF